MDPLSVSASVAGLLTAAAQISSLLIKFANSAKGAPKQAQSVLIEVKDISGILHHVQLFLLGQMAASRSRASMLLVEQLLVTLTGCVITFSELEDILTDLKTEGAMHTLDRINWARKESKIAGIISRLQNHKSSLNLMLTILECKSRAEAERSVDRLCELVEEVLANNIDMAIRLRGIESRPGYNSVTSAKLKNVNGSEQSTIVSEIERPPKPQENINLGQKFRSAFEEDLDKSKVYKRALYNSSQSSVISSAARSTATSVLSGLSLGDVSIIAVFALPLYSSDITNNKHYAFGDVAEQPLNLVAGEPREVSKKPTLKPWKQSSSQILGRLMSRGPSASPSTESEPGKVFGVALETSLNYARIEVVKQGNPVITAYIPIVVARCALFLKEHATDVRALFRVSGSWRRIQALQADFDRPPRFGKDSDWSGYTIHDAANLLLRYLNQLPESLIPVAFYNRALSLAVELGSPAFEADSGSVTESVKVALGSIIRAIPQSHRSTLLYLLDFIEIFASKEEINGLSSDALAFIFNTCILANHAMEEITDPEAYEKSRIVVRFMIEFSGYFVDDINNWTG